MKHMSVYTMLYWFSLFPMIS